MSERARPRLFGLPLDTLTMEATVASIERHVAERRPGTHVGLNAANVVTARSNTAYAHDLESSDLVAPDGQSVVWAGRLFGLPVRERVTGIDLMLRLVKLAAANDWGVYLVGAREPVVAEVARRLTARGIRVTGHRDGYFDVTKDGDVAASVVASGAQLLFVGMPSPRKERFIIGATRPAGVPFSVGVGGSFDVLAGRVRRAPRLAQRMGLEWAYRLAQEPRRLGWRYTVNNARFISLVSRELVGRALRGRRRP